MTVYEVADLLPHAPPMILLDSVVSRDAERLVAAVGIRPGIPFFQPGRGVAAHVAIEWMAQACGCFIGAEARDSAQPVRLGFLLGTRNFKAAQPWYVEGEQFAVQVTLVFRDDAFGSFDCTVLRRADGSAVATAQLSVFQPQDTAALLASQGLQMPS